jgi:hypothetical protein
VNRIFAGKTSKLLLGLSAGVIALCIFTYVSANSSDPSNDVIHACVKSSNGSIRIVEAGSTCKSNESPLNWNLIGPEGPTGPSGPLGPSGPQGPSGSLGAIGPTGPVGPRGDSGASGAQGSQGPIGPQGPTGPTGTQGPIGAKGPVGPTGPSSQVSVYRVKSVFEVQGGADSGNLFQGQSSCNSGDLLLSGGYGGDSFNGEFVLIHKISSAPATGEVEAWSVTLRISSPSVDPVEVDVYAICGHNG